VRAAVSPPPPPPRVPLCPHHPRQVCLVHLAEEAFLYFSVFYILGVVFFILGFRYFSGVRVSVFWGLGHRYFVGLLEAGLRASRGGLEGSRGGLEGSRGGLEGV
jgi:hypothetical protein